MSLQETVTADMRRWLERAVVGLNLCPFAKAVLVKGQVHFAVSEAEDAAGVLSDFERELAELVARPAQERDTTLLALPLAFADFYAFNDFTGRIERLVRKRGLEGVVQVAHFHPAFVFAGTEEDDITNYTNRAPYPTLHLLREESLDRAVEAFPRPEAIFEANMARLRELGLEGWNALDVGPRR